MTRRSEKKRSSGFTREERMEAARKGFKDLNARGGAYYMISEDDLKEMDIRKFVPAPGKVYLGILPRTEAPVFYKTIHVHYSVGPSKAAFLCPERMYDQRCPICDYRNELIKNDADKEEFKEFYPSQRVLMWIVDMESKKTIAQGVQLYDAPAGVVKGISEQVVDDRTDEMIVDIVEDPVNIVFKRTGKGFDTKYTGYKLEDRDEEIPDEYYDDIPSMDDILIVPDVKDMEKAIGTVSEEKDSEEEEEEKPRKRKARSRDESEEDEDEKPSRSRRQRKVEPEPEEEDLDDDDVPFEEPEEAEDLEEDEDTPPRRSRRKAKEVDSFDDILEPEEEDEEEEVKTKRDKVKRNLRGRRSR